MFHFGQRTEFTGCATLICHPSEVLTFRLDYFEWIHSDALRRGERRAREVIATRKTASVCPFHLSVGALAQSGSKAELGKVFNIFSSIYELADSLSVFLGFPLRPEVKRQVVARTIRELTVEIIMQALSDDIGRKNMD